MYELCDEYDMMEFIEIGRIRWAGHVMRMEGSDPARKMLCTKLGGSGDRRKRQTQAEVHKLEENVLKLECRNWRINAQSREEVKCQRGL